MGVAPVLWLLLLLLLPALPGAAAPPPFVVGQTGPLTGRAKGIGQRMHAGAAIAFAELNAAGGIHGRNVTLISLDDGYEPGPAGDNVRQLLDVHNALLLVGVSGTPIAHALRPLVLERRVPYIGPLTGAPVTRTPFHEEFVNVRASYPDEMVAMATFLVERLRVQRVACLYQNDTFGEAGLRGLTGALAHAGLGLVASGAYTRNALDVEGALEAMLGATARPQAVVLVALQAQNVKFIQAYRADPRADPDCHFLLMSVGATASFAAAIGPEHWPRLYFFQVLFRRGVAFARLCAIAGSASHCPFHNDGIRRGIQTASPTPISSDVVPLSSHRPVQTRRPRVSALFGSL